MLATVAAGNHEVLKLIIKHHPSGSRDASKMLYTSCKDACLKDVATLVRAGADINIGQRGWTPLMRAVASNAASIVQMIIDLQARNLQQLFYICFAIFDPPTDEIL